MNNLFYSLSKKVKVYKCIANLPKSENTEIISENQYIQIINVKGLKIFIIQNLRMNLMTK